ncbi:MAG: GNAT family N-acetyltransferase [Clostridiales bacterium]|nr:GNAT family N-acetyltransferase [Clostridiales bacterium]
MVRIETQRLILRDLEAGDLDDFYQYVRNPQVGPNAGWKPHESLEESGVILHDMMEKQEVWAIGHRADEKLIGTIGLHKDALRGYEKARMLGFVLDPAYWGRGLATEAARAVLRHAFLDLHLGLVSCNHFCYNLRSKRVIEKCGFTHEGTLRRGFEIYNGEIHDVDCYSMTLEEFHRMEEGNPL